MSEYTTIDAVNAVLAGQPGAFDDAVRGILADKMIDAVDQVRTHVASNLYSPEEEVNDDEEVQDDDGEEAEE